MKSFPMLEEKKSEVVMEKMNFQWYSRTKTCVAAQKILNNADL